jgi:L-ascorbate metabolism protein UlaG (beta-lactamase superfamily)
VPNPREQETRITVVGHATLLIQSGGVNMLTDPLFSERASPFSFAGPRRVSPPGVRFEDLPKIDIVLLSHNHYDHLDVATLKKLVARDDPRIITPLGNDTIVRKACPAPAPRRATGGASTGWARIWPPPSCPPSTGRRGACVTGAMRCGAALC